MRFNNNFKKIILRIPKNWLKTDKMKKVRKKKYLQTKMKSNKFKKRKQKKS